jgi:hypothetical protein
MEATVVRRMTLYCRSVILDFGVPQCVVTIKYEENDSCTPILMPQKPTPRTRTINIKYHVLCQWVEQDLVRLERVSLTLEVVDIFTKQLGPLLLRRHCNYLIGRVPLQYSVHFQNTGKLSNPVCLQQGTTWVKRQEQ